MVSINTAENRSVGTIYIVMQFLLVFTYPQGNTLIGDMLYPTEEVKEHRAGAYGIVGSNQNLTWPDNRIPYEFHSTVTKNSKFHRRVMTAIADIMNAVPNCIRFEPRKRKDKYWLRIQNVDERIPNCYSEVGFRNKSPQIIELRPRCPQGTFVHEMLHTAGYLHEHTRNDRDNYVQVDWENIYNRFKINYITDKESGSIKPAYETSYYGVPYNYESIMHYPLNGGNTVIDPDKPAMLHKKNKTGLGYNKEPGQRHYLSHGDLIMMAYKHGCAMPNRYQYELTDAPSSSNADFEAVGIESINDFEEPLQETDPPVEIHLQLNLSM